MFNLDPQQFTSLLLFVFSLLFSAGVYAYHWFLHRLPGNQQARLTELVATGVKAAQQVGGSNTDKKRYALTAIENLCAQFKIHFDPIVVGHFVEAAVLELKTLVPASTPLVGTVLSTADAFLNDVISQQPTATSTAVNPGTVIQPVQMPAMSYTPQGLPSIP